MTGIALLLDENLSEALLPRIRATFPGSTHVRRTLGGSASDRAIWEHARDTGAVLVTRDEDFQRLSTLHGAPPKVIWLAGHNLGNAEIAATLEAARDAIVRFVADENLALLAIQSR